MSSSYLVPGTGADGTQLWVVTTNDDGTSSAHELVAIYPGGTPYPGGSAFSEPQYATASNPFFTPFKNGFLFVASGIANENAGPNYPIDPNGTKTGREMWYTDGTASGTHLVYDANQGVDANGVGNSGFSSGNSPQTTLTTGGIALFVATTDSGGHTGLFATDGTSAGTRQLQIHNVSYPTSLLAVNGKALFTATVTPVAGGSYSALYVTDGIVNSDGTAPGTHQIAANVSSVEASITSSGGQEAFFLDASSQLWVTDGTATTELTTAAVTGSVPHVGSSGKFLVDLGNGRELFFGSGQGGGADLWATNGSAAGTSLIHTAVAPAAVSSYAPYYGSFVTSAGTHEGFFESPSGASGQALWVSDGTAAGTVQIASWASVSSANAVAGGRLFFEEADAGNTVSLHSTDGTVAGTASLAASGVGNTLHLGPAGDVVFAETDTTGAASLFISDGTAAGTHAISSGLTYFGNYTAAGSEFFFTAKDATGSYGLWAEGTSGSAVEVLATGASAPTQLTPMGSELFFDATNASGTGVSYITDGTPGGTHQVQGGVIAPGGAATPFVSTALPCFLAGTRLRTPDGEVAVEALREGDLVLTASGAAKPVVWIGNREVDIARHPAPDRVGPVRIRRDAFGPGLPLRDLLLSPDHAVLVEGVLIPAHCLLDGISITQDARRRAHYFHVELALHDIVLAEGLAVESYLETGNRGGFEGGDAPTRLHPDFWALHWENACAPLVLAGPAVDAARARLMQQRGGLAAAA